MTSVLITSGTLVNEHTRREADLFIRDGRIEEIGANLAHRAADQVIEADGCLVMPGMIDDQVHFREPGLEHKGNLATESRAAIAGGITSIMEMPNTDPQTIDNAALQAKHDRAAGRCATNYSFYLGATNSNLEAIKAVDKQLACGIKIFMGASTGNMLVDDPDTLEAIFANAPLVVATHCEDTPMIEANHAEFSARLGEALSPADHPKIRSREACLKSSTLAVGLARKHGTRLHVLHLTTAEELALFSAGDITSKQITVEACVHHLYFDADDYETLGNDIKCNPAIKAPSDRIALLQAVADDVIDIVATDHAPHSIEEKARPYAMAPAGLPLVQHALLSLTRHVEEGALTMEQVVQKVCHAPALRFEVQERGFLREGWHADITVVDPNAPTVVADQPVLAKCGWTPFRNVTFPASIRATLVNGRIAFDGTSVSPEVYSTSLAYDRM